MPQQSLFLLFVSLSTLLAACGKSAVDDTAPEDDTALDDGPYAACEVDLTPEGLSPGECRLTIYDERDDSTEVTEVWYSDGALQEVVESVEGAVVITETFAYYDDGLLHTVETSWEGLYHGLRTYSYDAEGRALETVDDEDLDGLDLSRTAYTYTVEGSVESVLTEKDYGDDGVIDSRVLKEDDRTLYRETSRYDQDNDGHYEMQWHDWYNPCGDSEVMEFDITGDGEIDGEEFRIYDYNDQGLPLRVETDNSEGDALDALVEHTYLPSGHLESSTFYDLDDGEWVLRQTHRYDWSDCELSSVDPMDVRP